MNKSLTYTYNYIENANIILPKTLTLYNCVYHVSTFYTVWHVFTYVTVYCIEHNQQTELWIVP